MKYENFIDLRQICTLGAGCLHTADTLQTRSRTKEEKNKNSKKKKLAKNMETSFIMIY